MAQEFLPLCDVLFNIISLASYFCDIVFDVVTIYTLYITGQVPWFVLALSFVMLSLLVSQCLSLRWYWQRNSTKKDIKTYILMFVHVLQCGVLWRYFKLFLPVNLSIVKYEVRDLCMLRLIHAFCEAAPMLLIQLYLVWGRASSTEVTDLNLVSTLLSLFSVCWALASFSKNVRRRNIHKLVLTWLGVIFQFFWRLGTVSSRVVALTVYATLYHYWVFLVIGLHWLTMFLWLISPKNVFYGELITRRKKIMYSMLIAFVYIFCYINLQEKSSRQKTAAFYVTMLLENSLLVAVVLALSKHIVWYQNISAVVVWGGFALGIGFMLLYYQFFHIRHLKHTLPTEAESNCEDCLSKTCTTHITKGNPMNGDAILKNGGKCAGYPPFTKSHSYAHCNGSPFQNGIPGVFNCRLNPALKRKKKKPSTFVPPPPVPPSLKTLHPFWRRVPTVVGKSCSSDLESVGSRVNIQQKLQEKKQQQEAELREIEEEIRLGKLLQKPLPEEALPSPQPPPPQGKRPPLHPPPKTKQRSQTPEILLVPNSLDMYCEYQDARNIIYPLHAAYARTSDASSNISGGSRAKICPRNTCRCPPPPAEGMGHVPSDLDSQISLPRSYTLPREFRYYRRPRPRKPLRTEHFAPSNNSSDGDVDSEGENLPPLPTHHRLRNHLLHRGQLHETKL